jgi:thioredoxin 2
MLQVTSHAGSIDMTADQGTAGRTTGPISTLRCAHCAKANRIRPSERGAPHCGSCEKPLPWLVNAGDETFDVEARTQLPVLVDLWAPWCGPCRFVGPIVASLAAEYAGRLKVVKVNVDESPAIAARYEARSIPTLLILRDGQPVDRIVGAMPKDALTARLLPHLLRSRS